jgi:hypothetical protein
MGDMADYYGADGTTDPGDASDYEDGTGNLERDRLEATRHLDRDLHQIKNTAAARNTMNSTALTTIDDAEIVRPRSSGGAIALRDANGEMSVEAIVARRNRVREVMEKVMVHGEHYGKINGCGNKPALLKPGAEMLCMTFGMAPKFKVTRTELGNGHREVEVTCTLIHIATEAVVAEGLGSCSTMEKKYRWRRGERKCPQCGAAAIIKSKYDDGGWYCFDRKGGCRAKWPSGAREIEDQEAGQIENPDVADQWNTVLKMAVKRAHVAATLTATGASDILTQDIEDGDHDDEHRGNRGWDYSDSRDDAQGATRPHDTGARGAGRPEIRSTDHRPADDRRENPPPKNETLSPDRIRQTDGYDAQKAQKTQGQRLEEIADALIADIDNAQTVTAVRDLQPRFSALPKGTKARDKAYAAYNARITSLGSRKVA